MHCVWRWQITNICAMCCVCLKIRSVLERKIQFFVAVYQHLRERIRQDIIRTDDPVKPLNKWKVNWAPDGRANLP